MPTLMEAPPETLPVLRPCPECGEERALTTEGCCVSCLVAAVFRGEREEEEE
jgi:hypothetical protein